MWNLRLPLIVFFVIRSGFWMFMFFYFGTYLVQNFNFNRSQAVDVYVVLAFWSIMMLNILVKWVKVFFAAEIMVLMTSAL